MNLTAEAPIQNSEFRIQNSLPLMEAFYTLQGEGFHQGRAAYFIRLAGCDVGCHWCDVKESWNADRHPKVAIDDMVREAARHPTRLAVITGGEPLMHDLTDLTAQLRTLGFQTNIETSGAYPLTGQWDWICLSPKKFKKPLEEIYQRADELKVIVFNRNDFAYAEAQAARVGPGCQLLLQPEWGKSAEMLPLMIGYVKDNPRWRVSLQTHKFMDIP
ncbi:MAG: 7-carboxy-7-deazaguanine synthase QueE [Cytophagaceae bacterium]|nr:7-carboxy-7-deazaguanine synthase QueE [Cytophagaceae bacterium]